MSALSTLVLSVNYSYELPTLNKVALLCLMLTHLYASPYIDLLYMHVFRAQVKNGLDLLPPIMTLWTNYI